MKLEIRNGFEKTLGGASTRHDEKKTYGEELIGLLNSVWPKIRVHKVKQDGINIVVYDTEGTIFAGVGLSIADAKLCGLESKTVRLKKYVYVKHVGPYSLISQTGAKMAEEISAMGHKPIPPMVEIYGHWTEDESKLETEILQAISE